MGYFGYDLVRCIEDLPCPPVDDTGLPDCCLLLCREIIAYDHLKQRIMLIVNVQVDAEKQGIVQSYQQGLERLERIMESIAQDVQKEGAERRSFIHTERLDYHSNLSRESYQQAVTKAKEYIRNGDIFQVVLSQRLTVKYDQDPFNVYRMLRVLNPSPYMYYLNYRDFTVVGSSPERLVRVDQGVVETCPIAGTRPRGSTEEEDQRLEKELLADEKELAEHTMLVDLGRNDLGKISRFGTVKVENPLHIERFSHVMHIVSNVKGTLRGDKDSIDALTAVLPAGTLSGAPKVRAMEIIDRLEPTKRGLYGGAIGYIGFDGTMDTCITIRTIVFQGNKAYIQAGAGIVAESVPDKEYEETLNKAGALLKALEQAGGIS